MATEISVDITKEQLSAMLQAMSPFKVSDTIKLSFIDSNIVLEAEESGTTGRITVGNETVQSSAIGNSIWVSKSVLSQIAQYMPNVSTFIFKNDDDVWTEMQINLGGDEINIGLPIFDKEIDNDYVIKESELIDTELFDKALTRACSALVKGSVPMGCIEIGNTLRFGASVAFSEVSRVTQEILVKVKPEMQGFLHNICKVGSEMQIIITEDNKVVFKVENVEYKTDFVNHMIPDITLVDEFTEDSEDPEDGAIIKASSEFVCNISDLKQSLNRLSIPLGEGSASITLNVEDAKLRMEVFDLQGRKSESIIDIKATDKNNVGDEICRIIDIGWLQQIISVMEQSTTVRFCKRNSSDYNEILMFEDSVQKTYVTTEVI